MLKQKIKLSELSHYKIGGTIEYFLDFNTLEELLEGLKEWQKVAEENKINPEHIFILGKGTNILFADSHFKGLVIRNSISYIKNNGALVEIGAGTPVAELNDFCIKNSLSGTEWSGGLPGSFGGAIFGNAGAFGGETKDHIESVTSLELSSLNLITRTKAECRFEYRNSIFKRLGNKEIILWAKVKLTKGNQAEIRNSIEEKINYRKERQPLEYPNIGSTFKNLDVRLAPKELVKKCQDQIKTDPFPVIPAAYLISLAGLKGKKIGGAQISEKHPNFIINLGSAKASDVRQLISLVQSELIDKFGVSLETEVIIRD